MSLKEFGNRPVISWSENSDNSGSSPGFRRFEFSDGNSNKFWEIKLHGSSFTVKYGRIGTQGLAQTKDFPSAEKAQKEYEKLIGEKVNKGYEEIESASADASGSGGAALRPNCSYYIGLTYDEASSGIKWTSRFDKFLEQPGIDKVWGIVVGQWIDTGNDEDSSSVVDALVEASGRLPNVRALFLGDIEQEESEISWINQSDVSPLFSAFPNLEYFGVRGGNGLSLGSLNHSKLRSLVIESGGLPATVIHELISGHLPELEELFLWLGVEDYGFDATIGDMRPLLDNNPFPKLKYLGLMNSEITDQIAEALKDSPILQRIQWLDLSMGTLTDEGAQALLDNPEIRKLRKLNLSHHFLSQEMMRRLNALGIDVDLSDRKETEEYDGETYRFVAVSE
jgi:predicted DNA-binding WGR domain protein